MEFPVSHLRFLRLMLVLLGGGLVAARGCEVACYPPSGSSKTYNSSEERAITEARCYSACLERVSIMVIAWKYVSEIELTAPPT